MNHIVDVNKKMPKCTERCITSNQGCACLEWRYEKMERALKVLQVWAANGVLTGADVERLCAEALEV